MKSALYKPIKNKSARTQLLVKNVVGTFGIRCISMLSSFLMVPLTIKYINSDLYGIWITLSSIIHWFSFLDIGLGHGLKNKLAEALALRKYVLGKYYVSTTYFFLLLIFGSAAILALIISPHLNWASFLGIAPEYNIQLMAAVQILAVFFFIQMILKVLINVIQAYQLNAIASFLDALIQILSLVAVYILTITTLPSLKNLAFVFSVVPVLVYFIASLLFYKFKFKKVAPSIGFINTKFAGKILNLGGKFFIIQIATIVIYQSINILISRLAGPEYVTQYNVAYKYLSIITMVFSIVLTPLWPAITDAYVKKDFKWIRNIYNKMLRYFVLMILIVALMILVSPLVFKIWLRDMVQIDITLTIFISFYVCLNLWNSFHSAILNGMGKIYLQLLFSVGSMVLTIPLAIALGTKWHIYGILSSIILLSIPTSVVSRVQIKKLLNKDASTIWNK